MPPRASTPPTGKPAKRAAGIDSLRWHDLRHTAVALAIAQGAHPKAIQARLGHSSVQVTLDRYGHLFPGLDAAIADGLEGTSRRPCGSSPEEPKTARETRPVTHPGHRSHAEDTKSWHLAVSRGHCRTRQKLA
ncbi:MAG TPA: tyrosine-type recombinase/integrase [Acidimicrobiia bacterium]|nr:tyrosine-type recombinase/integrase [Acidimicrobiia bacterium]